MKYQIDLYEYDTNSTSAIDTINAPIDYTAADYINDCKQNSDIDYINLITKLGNEIILIPID